MAVSFVIGDRVQVQRPAFGLVPARKRTGVVKRILPDATVVVDFARSSQRPKNAIVAASDILKVTGRWYAK